MARPDVTAAPRGRPLPLRALLWFWAALGVALLAGAGTLQVLGPPEATPPIQVAAPAAPSPAGSPAPSPAASPTASPAASPTASPAASPATELAAAPVLPASPGPSATAPAAPPPAAPTPAAAAMPLPRAPGAAIPPPNPALEEPSGLRDGSTLPRIAPTGGPPDGTGKLAPMRAFAAGALPKDARPRVAILMADFAMREGDSEEALRRLPDGVSLAVSPYAARPGPLVAQARQAGRELWLSVPMEPKQFPLDDPGNRALLTGAPLAQNLVALRWALSRLGGYVGATGALGSLRGERFAASAQMEAVLEELGMRGLMYVDPRVDGHLPPPPAGMVAPRRAVDVVLDEPAVRTEIEAKLERLEQLARDRGSALGLASAPVPVTIDRLAAWGALLAQRGIVLVPVSALLLPP